MRSAKITIDTDALHHNLYEVKRLTLPKTKVLVMMKADAYGHGVANCLGAVWSADGIGVACLSEAEEVRQLGWMKTLVLIEGVFSELEWQQAINHNFQCVIHQSSQLHWALSNLPNDESDSQTIWLKINTGMNRLGFAPKQVASIARQLYLAGYKLVLTSHLANADDITAVSNQQQIAVFKQTLKTVKLHLADLIDTDNSDRIQASLCNSAGIINFPDCHFDWVRPGIMLYGSSPMAIHPSPIDTDTSSLLNDREVVSNQPLSSDILLCNILLPDTVLESVQLKPVMHLQAQLMAIHPIEQGRAVGYGSRYIACQPILKGIVSIGYGDGYPRVVDERAWVAVSVNTLDTNTVNHKALSNHKAFNQNQSTQNLKSKTYACPIIGRVSMDMLAIDISKVYASWVQSLTYQPYTSANVYPQDFGLSLPTLYNQFDSIITGLLNSVVTLWGDSAHGAPVINDVSDIANTISYELLCRVTQRPTRQVIGKYQLK